MAESTVTPKRLNIGDLLYGRNPFEVPRYQRAYAWDADEIDDFVSDMNAVIEARAGGNERTHFFGGMVSVTRTLPATLKGLGYEVVDGQQRLATFMITVRLLVEALRDLAVEAEQVDDSATATAARNHADKIKDDYLFYSDIDQAGVKRQLLRLNLSMADRAYFVELLDDNSTSCPSASGRESHRLLLQAYATIRQKIFRTILDDTTTPADRKLEGLLWVRDAIIDASYVIHIVAEDRAEAYTLFTVLNDRGKSLSDGDLLRALTLELVEAHPIIQDKVATDWDEILASSENQLDKFLRAYFPSVTGHRAPQQGLFDSYQKAFFHVDGELDEAAARHVLAQVGNLRKESQTFGLLVTGEWPFERATSAPWSRERLQRVVHTLKHDLCMPLLLAAAAHQTEASFADLVSLVERFAFRYKNVAGGHATAAGKAYYHAAAAIRNPTTAFSFSAFRQELAALIDRASPDEVFTAAIAQRLDYARAAQRSNIKYFLTTIEDYLPWIERGAVGDPSPDMTKVLDLHRIEIEHIYPQNPVVASAELDEEKDRIGNLTFWVASDNKAASNGDFEAKRPFYSTAGVQLTRELGSLVEWNASALGARRDRLIEYAQKVFRF